MKKILCLFLICVYVFSLGTIAFATEITETTAQTESVEIAEVQEVEETTEEPAVNPSLITEVYAFSGSLYYCDTPTGRVVLKSLVPLFATEKATKMAKEAEYLEIKLSPDGVFMADGTKNSVDSLNVFADSDVWVIIVRTADGNLEIPYFSFR